MNTKIPVSELTFYGIGRDIVDCLLADGVEFLLPLQAQAVAGSGLLRGGNLLVLAPTSAGKTLVGELAAVRRWQGGRKAVFLSPTKALAGEQFRHLRRRYERAGVRVVLSTADHTRHDGEIAAGQFDFAVMVYEKFRAFVVGSPGLVCSLGVVVADEIQMLHDRERGAAVDLLLSRVSCVEPGVQIIGMSAVLEDAAAVAGWLDAEILQTTARASQLREGVFCVQHGCLHYKDAQGEWADETLAGGGSAVPGVAGGGTGRGTDFCAELGGTDCAAQAAGLAAALARSGENCLVFVPTRSLSRQFALAVAEELGIDAGGDARATAQEILVAEESAMRGQLMRCLPAGVAFHNSDLTAELRALVENWFNEGRVRVLVATPTLAQGVNLAAKNVIQIPVMLGAAAGVGGGNVRRPQVALSLDRYRNQAGRAGRLGMSEAYGRSILVARSHTEATRLARQYLEAGQTAGVLPQATENLEAFILDFVEAGLAGSFTELFGMLTNTFGWRAGGEGRAGGDVAMEDQVADCVRRLLEWNLLEETAAHRLRATELGQAAAAGGFRAETIVELTQWCAAWRDGAPSDLEILLACGFTLDGETFPISANREEVRGRRWTAAAEAILRRENAWAAAQVQAALRPAGGLSAARHNALKMAVAAHAWVSRRETAELEQELGMSAGALGAAAAHLAWLASGLQSCARVAGCPEEATAQIGRLAARLPVGLCRRAQGLCAVQVPGLTRNYLHALADEGLDSIPALKGADADMLARLLPRPLAALVMQEFSEAAQQEIVAAEQPENALVETAEPVIESNETTTAEPGEMELILDNFDPGTVVFRGRKVQLSPKPYALLGVLASRCGSTVSYREIDEKVWPQEKVEPQQISAHKSTLVRELARASSLQDARGVVVTTARFGLRLNLDPARVQVRVRV